MKKSHFKIGLLTACLVSVSSVASAQTCGAEACDSGACKCSKKHCDDKGLLEVINSTASNFEAKLASMIPDRDAPCVKTKSKCDCAKCSGGGASQPSARTSVPKPVPHIAPPVAQPDAVRSPIPRMTPPPNPIVDPVPAPVPNAVTPEAVPLPDSRVNPFKDEPQTRNLRPVRGRPASYLRSNEIEYDPQASNQNVMHSVLVSKAASKKITDSSNGLAKTSSTRRVLTSSDASETKEQSVFEQAPPAVVPASINAPITRLRPLSTMPPAADQFINPLRAN
jgi:hypothetical protein